MKKWIMRIILAFIIAAAINFTWEYFSLLKIAKGLSIDLNKTRIKVTELQKQLDTQIAYNKRLEDDKQFLRRELASAQEEIEISKMAIDRLEQDLDGLKIHVSALERNNVLLRLRLENLTLAKKQLESQVDKLIKEKTDLEARFYSLGELEKAMKFLKQNPAEQRGYQPIMHEGDTSGNAGFIIKGGESTYKPTVNIKVLPAP
jgi:chromosome segregation ATPase